MTLKKPLLSFCIPTYNRADTILECVKNILKYEGDEIEVVVSNNCSNDDTLEKLEQIKDERLKVHTNKSNLGFDKNVIKVLEEANGEYCLYLNDREIVIIEKVPIILELLSKGEYDLIITSIIWKSSDIKSTSKVFLKNKIKNLLRFLYYRKNISNYYFYYHKNKTNKLEIIRGILSRGHPTGIIWRSNNIDFKQLWSYDKEDFGMYPHVYIMLMVNDNGKTYFSKEACTVTMVNPKPSYTISESKKLTGNPYPHPESRFNQMKDRLKWLEELNLSGDEKRLLTLYIFKSFLTSSKLGYIKYTSEDEKKVSTIDFNKISNQLLDLAKSHFQKTDVVIEYDDYVIELARKFLDEILINKSKF